MKQPRKGGRSYLNLNQTHSRKANCCGSFPDPKKREVGLSKPKSGDGERITVSLPSHPSWLFLCKLPPLPAVKRNAFQAAFIAFLS